MKGDTKSLDYSLYGFHKGAYAFAGLKLSQRARSFVLDSLQVGSTHRSVRVYRLEGVTGFRGSKVALFVHDSSTSKITMNNKLVNAPS